MNDDEVERMRLGLKLIAQWFGPGNNQARVLACQALGIDHLARHDFDFGPPPDWTEPASSLPRLRDAS